MVGLYSRTRVLIQFAYNVKIVCKHELKLTQEVIMKGYIMDEISSRRIEAVLKLYDRSGETSFNTPKLCIKIEKYIDDKELFKFINDLKYISTSMGFAKDCGESSSYVCIFSVTFKNNSDLVHIVNKELNVNDNSYFKDWSETLFENMI